MAVNFPANPINGDQFTIGNKVYTYNGVTSSWERTVSTAPQTTDARTLEGYDGDFYLDYTNHTNTPFVPTDVGDLLDENNLLFDYQYSSLTGAPAIPTDVSDLTDTTNKFNDFDGDYLSLTSLPTLFSGSWNDLQDRPTIPTDIPTDVAQLTDENDIIPSSIDAMEDVDTSGKVDGQSIIWDDSIGRWVPGNAVPDSVGELGDVDTTTKVDGYALIWNEEASKWLPGRVDTTNNIDGGRADTNFSSSTIIVLDGGTA